MDDPVRVLYVPNEIGTALQSGYRRAFADLKRARLVAEVDVVSLQKRVLAAGDEAERQRERFVRLVQQTRPDVMLLQHAGATGLTVRHFEALRPHVGSLVYHEADPYSRWLHPLPAAAGLAGRHADVVHTVGAGVFSANFRRTGARQVLWTPHVFDPGRVDEQGNGQAHERVLDVVVIANRNRPRIRPLPSARERARFVGLLEQAFGDRVAVFGRGWDGPAARGPIPYSDQAATIRSAWVSANWDHYAREPRYFSDRLPISLASGSIHATTRHLQYEQVFPPSTADFLLTADRPEDLVERIRAHLSSTTPAQRVDAERRARAFAWRGFRQDDHLVSLLNSGGASIDPDAARAAWDLTTPMLTDE